MAYESATPKQFPPRRPSNDTDVILRFSMRSPHWPFTFSYGMLHDPTTRMTYASLDHYLGYHMLARYEDRDRVVTAPNGYISYRELQDILSTSEDFAGNPVVSPTWEQDRDAILAKGLRLKYGQSSFLRDSLVRTAPKKILDQSREEELYWCHCNGKGKNQHGIALMELRERLLSGENISLVHP